MKPVKKGKGTKPLVDDAALSALEGITDQLSNIPRGVSWEDEEVAIEGLKAFAGALRESRPEARFTSAEVQAWAKIYYESIKQPLPIPLTVGKTISRLLRDCGEDTGIVEAPSGQFGRKTFMVKP